jgi:RHS repeat-associated protein
MTLAGALASSAASAIPPHSTGKERDSESGLDYFGARHYASSMGRWMVPDRLNLTSARLVNPTNTLNKYVYGGNNPLKYIDKDGKDITIFYRPPSGASGDYGHIMLGALNQATGKVGFLDYYPAGNVNGLGQGPGAFNTGNMSERAAQNADGKFATLTIQTSPEEAQKVLDLIGALKNGSAPDYSALTNNCTTVCEDVLHDLGLDFGDVFPSSYWGDVYNNFSADAQAHPIWTRMMGVHGTPGNEYGNPRNFPGVNNFSQWLFTLYQNQQQQPQPKACVEVDDGLGNHSKSCD